MKDTGFILIKLNQKIRDNLAEGMEIEAAVEAAIESCIKENIMADFLIKEKAGVIRMHVLDYNEEKHRESLIQEGFDRGISQGLSQGLSQGISEKTLDVIRNMLIRGQSDQDIIAIAECTQDQIEAVRRELK